MRFLRERFVRLVPVGALGRSVGILVSGTAIGQALAVLSSPLLTRIYAPSDLGTLGLYASLLGLLTVVACLRYEQAIALPEDPVEASSVVVLSLILLIGTSGITLLATLLIIPRLSLPPTLTDVRPLVWFLPVSMFGVGLYQTLSFWAIRSKQFGRLAGTSWRQGMAGAVSQILLGVVGLGSTGLVIGQVVGQTAGIAALSRLLTHAYGFSLPGVSWQSICMSAKRYRKFPMYSTWSDLLSVASMSVPLVLIAVLFGPVAAGFYSIGLRALQTPMRTLGNAVSQVFLAELPQAAREGRLGDLLLPALDKLAAATSPAAVVFTLSWPPIAQLAFGSGWREAGVYMQWLTPWIFLVMITAPLAPLFAALERQGTGLRFNAAFLVVRVSALLIGGRVGGAEAAIALFALSSFLLQWFMLEWLGSVAGMGHKNVRRVIGKRILRALPLALPLFALKLIANAEINELLGIAYSIAAAGYFGVRGMQLRGPIIP